MIPALRISDALRSIVFHELKGPNLACAKATISSSQSFGSRGFRARGYEFVSFWKDALIQRQDRVTQVWKDGQRLRAAGSARMRCGAKVWEIDHLYLQKTTPGFDFPEDDFARLLDDLVLAARERGAERVFLRCFAGSEVTQLAQRAGFFHYFNQVLLEKDVTTETSDGASGGTSDASDGAEFVRERLPHDTHGLFQLFSAATPQQVRVGLGFTLEQWRDAQEPRRGQEWVSHQNDRLTGWAAAGPQRADTYGEVMIHPDHPELLPVMARLILSQPGPQKWLVPDYQEATHDLLSRKGFQETSEYAILAKTVAAREFSHSMTAVEA